MFVCQRKFVSGDGGLLRVVWMPKMLKNELKERLEKRAEELGIPDLIADETIGTSEEEILPFSRRRNIRPWKWIRSCRQTKCAGGNSPPALSDPPPAVFKL